MIDILSSFPQGVYWLFSLSILFWVCVAACRMVLQSKDFYAVAPYLRAYLLVVFVVICFVSNEAFITASAERYLITPAPALALLLGLCFGPFWFAVSQHWSWLQRAPIPILDTNYKKFLFLFLIPLLEETVFRVLAVEWLQTLPSWLGVMICMIAWMIWRLTPRPREWAVHFLMGFIMLNVVWLSREIYSIFIAHASMNILLYLKQRKHAEG